ncbi:hypothetical protein LINPERPRIM_LOCUS20051 [Linum perenne]
MDTQTPNPSQTLGSNGGVHRPPPPPTTTETVTPNRALVLPQTQTQDAPVTGSAGNSPRPNSRNVVEILDTSKHTSVVWGHFLKVRIENEIKPRRKYCQKLLAGQSNNGTTHLKTHMGNNIQRKIHGRSQKILGPDVFTDAVGKRELRALTYNPKVSRSTIGPSHSHV